MITYVAALKIPALYVCGTLFYHDETKKCSTYVFGTYMERVVAQELPSGLCYTMI